MKKLILFAIFLLLAEIAFAQQGHMYLLAVKEGDGSYTGSLADLYLEIKPGSGRVFIETLPLSKLDTQISTRFAKDIACDYLDKDCTNLDFFYTIKADSSIIGGPSAGAATSVLTAAVLEGIKIDESIAMTGTINSGGLVGPVGGLKAKIDAASKAKIKKVLIPKGEKLVKEKGFTFDLADYARKYRISVIEVADLSEALSEFAGKELKQAEAALIVSEDYTKVMSSLAEMLCSRSKELQKKVSAIVSANRKIVSKEFSLAEGEGTNNFLKGETAFKKGLYYSSASYCFGANTRYQELILNSEKSINFTKTKEEIASFEKTTQNTSITTLTDLEAYIVVKERLDDAKEHLNQSMLSYKKGEPYLKDLAYSIERIHSAISWSNFFGIKGKEFIFNKEILKQGCLSKLSEAEERYQYAAIFFPASVSGIKTNLNYAYEESDKENYELCMFKAGNAKAEADLILSVIGVEEAQLDVLLENKLNIVKRVIAREQSKGIFPVLGYSYYEYANTLKEEDQFTALLYAEYALELSNLDIYFKERSKSPLKEYKLPEFQLSSILIFAAGALSGAFAVMLIILIKRKLNSHNRRTIKTPANPRRGLRGKKR